MSTLRDDESERIDAPIRERGGEFSEQARRLLSGAIRADRLPAGSAVAGLVESARGLLFPGSIDGTAPPSEAEMEHWLRRFRSALATEVRGVLADHSSGTAGTRAPESVVETIADRVVEQLPEVQRNLWADVRAAFDGDPSLHYVEEAILCFPGVSAMLHHRLAHLLHFSGVPILPRMISERAHSLTGIDIHPGAEIGAGLFIDHGTGVVVGETAVIGKRVRLYQGVTLGAKRFTVSPDGRLVKGEPRHPMLGDDVVVYSGASILGRISIGSGSVICGNVWVTRDVPPGSVVTQARSVSCDFSHGAGI